MNGFLFIGDPHVTSIKPGRRKDDFVASVLNKLKAAALIAHRDNLLPVILGDLFHRFKENDLTTLNRLTRVLRSFPVTPLCLGGNHDKGETEVTEADALDLLATSGVIDVFDGEARLARVIQTPAGKSALWIAPYGAQIPTQIDRGDANHVVLTTHHDLAFEGCYPRAKELHPIIGCDMVVNGHMHKTAPSIQCGQTYWHNPGNIEPLSVDCIDHMPAVWSWVAGDSPAELTRHNVPHDQNCFDLTGLTVVASSTKDAVDAIGEALPVEVPASVSHFADLLGAQSTMEASRTEDDETFVKDLNEAFVEMDTSEPVCQILIALANSRAAPELQWREACELEEGAA